MFVLNEIRLLHTIRWSSWSILKRTKCEINDFSNVFFLQKLLAKHRLHRVIISYEMNEVFTCVIYLFITSICWYGNMHARHTRHRHRNAPAIPCKYSNSLAIPSLIAINKIDFVVAISVRVKRDVSGGGGGRVHQFVPGPVVASHRPWE
jgi:hypothetical protein